MRVNTSVTIGQSKVLTNAVLRLCLHAVYKLNDDG